LTHEWKENWRPLFASIVLQDYLKFWHFAEREKNNAHYVQLLARFSCLSKLIV